MFNPNLPLPRLPQSGISAQINLRKFMADVFNPLVAEKKLLQAYDKLINFFVDSGIKMIAADFDLTITTIHSGGYIPTETVPHSPVMNALSHEFNEFARRANLKGLKITVVTFADANSCKGKQALAGKDLVIAVLQNCRAAFRVEEVYAYYPVNYREARAFEELGLEAPMDNSKRFHLRKLCHDFNLKPWEVVLFDDTPRNCMVAAEDGFLSIVLDNDEGLKANHIYAA